jgi:MFS family permease
MGLTWPLLALVLDAQGVDSRLIGLSSSTQTLAILLMSPFAPMLVARLGMVPALHACLGGAAACLLLLRTFPDVYAWFPIRFGLGTCIAVVFIAGETWVNQLAPEESRGRVIGVFGFLWALSAACGPLIIRATGTAGWGAFVVGATLILVAGVPLLFASGVTPAMGAAPPRAMLRVIRLAPAAMLATTFLGTLDSVCDSFLPLYGLRNGLSDATAVTLLTVGMAGIVTVQLPIGWLADRFDRQRLLVAVTLLALASASAMPWVVGDPVLRWPVVFALGIAAGGLWSVSLVLIGERFRGPDLMAANAARGVLYGIGSVLSPAAAGYAIELWPPHGVVAVIVAACLMFLPLALRRDAARTSAENR